MAIPKKQQKARPAMAAKVKQEAKSIADRLRELAEMIDGAGAPLTLKQEARDVAALAKRLEDADMSPGEVANLLRQSAGRVGGDFAQAANDLAAELLR